MKVETVIPDQDKKLIEEYQGKIKEIINWHLDGINSDTAFGFIEMERAIKRIKTDPSIKLLEKAIEDIYIHTVPKSILIAESEEDKRMLEDMLNKNG